MITCDSIGYNGRMGNVLFKYAAMKGLANHLGVPAYLSPHALQGYEHGQSCCLQYFKYDCDVNPYYIHTMYQYYESSLEYDESFWQCTDNMNINGYFQSERYFQHIKDTIRQEFQLIDSIQSAVDNKMKQIRYMYSGCQLIGLHMRRGDDHHCNHRIYAPDTLEEGTWLYKYIKHAFSMFNDIQNKVYIVFTGGSRDNTNDDDVEWCKSHLRQFNVTFHVVSASDYIIDFGMMSMCDHVILNSISSLGWWAAYLNKNQQKRVVVPGYIPHGGNTSLDLIYNRHSFWADDFIKIHVE